MYCFKNSDRRYLAGFTLVEILLVVLILGVLAGLSLPNFSHTYKRLQLKKTAQDLAFFMRYAQSRAIAMNSSVRLEFDSEHSSYWLSEENQEEGGSQSYKRLTGRFGRIVTILPKINIQLDGQTIDFYSDGNIEKKSVTVCLEAQCEVVSTKEQRGFIHIYESS